MDIIYWLWISILGCSATFVFFFMLSGIKIVNQWQEGLIFTFGKYSGMKTPGITWIMPIVQKIIRVDIRVRTFDVEPQRIITKDSVTVKIDAVIYFKVINTKKSIIEVCDFGNAASKLAQTALRDVVGKYDLDTLLQKKGQLGDETKKQIQEPTDAWGIDVTNVEIKDVSLPEDMERAMAKEAEAVREKRARITKAEGELEASAKFRDAAKNMSDKAMVLRQLQTWQEIGTEQNSTIILVPNDLISQIK